MTGPAGDPVHVAFLGNAPWSVPPLRALAAAPDVDVTIVLTREPRPAGRGSALTPTEVASEARALSLPLAEVATVRSGAGLDALRSSGVDLLTVVAYGEILTPAVLAAAPAVNLHFSLLPRWRGASPVQHAILEGDQQTGVTTMMIDEGLDTGPLLLQAATPIEPDETTGALGVRLARIGGDLLVRTILELPNIERRPQDDALATAAPKLPASARSLPWREPADALVRRIRAFAPAPGAIATLRGVRLKVLRGEVVVDTGRAGTVLGVDAQGFTVAAGEGALRVLEVVPAGRSAMTGADFAHGVHLEPGASVG